MRKFLNDLPASFVVFLVALPLCMGVAIASGVPPALGIITGIVGGVVTGLFSGAPLQVSGPAAGLTVLVFQLVDKHGIEALGPVVLLAGLMQVGAGYARLGQWFRAVNPAVIYGMLSGIGVLIISSQIHIAFDSKPGGSPLENLMLIPKIFHHFFDFSNNSTAIAGAIGLMSLTLLFLWDKITIRRLKTLPAPLIAVTVAALLAMFFQFPVEYVKLPDSFIGSIKLPTTETWGMLFNETLFVSALGLAIIASAETLLCASALKKMKPDAEVKYDKELIAQGIGNTICGFFGALPMTGVIVRSTANIQAKGQTRWSAVMHGVWLLLFVLLAPQLLKSIPMASLAAVLIYIGFKLLNPSIVKSLSNYGKPAVVIYFITLFGIVFTDLLTGVLLGVAASFARLLTLFSKIDIKIEQIQGEAHVTLKGAATFLTLPKLASALEDIPIDKKVQLHFDEIFYIDHACMDLLESQKNLRKNHIANQENMVFDSSKLGFTWVRSESGIISHPPAPATPAAHRL